jgi:poly-gamma-glutamate capsule biosynthesis protein CapA/YwtB (metallophosphatase superfamily)
MSANQSADSNTAGGLDPPFPLRRRDDGPRDRSGPASSQRSQVARTLHRRGPLLRGTRREGQRSDPAAGGVRLHLGRCAGGTRAGVDLRIINLETSITSSEDYWRDKQIHYRMHPRNINCITAAGVDCCCLANNHVLDWGYDGLAETLRTLDAAGIAHTGAGRDAVEAAVPAVLDVPGKGRGLVFSYGSPTSGIPREWAATAHRPGVNFLKDTSEKTARRIAGEMRGFNRPCDVIVASIHWGETGATAPATRRPALPIN